MRMLSFILICLFTLSTGGFGQNHISFPYGEYWQFPDARTLAMAGSGAISNSSPSALILNPAALAASPQKLNVQVSTTARNLEERRSFPVYNRIDDITQQGIYVVNDHWFLQLQGAVQYNFQLSGFPYLKSAAIGVFNEIDQNFDYLEEVRENIFGDAQVAYNEINYDGGLTRYSGGLAFEIVEPLDFGVQIGLLSGDLDFRRSIEFVEAPEDNQLTSIYRTLDNTPLVVSLGAVYEIDSHFTLGSHLRLPYSLDYRAEDPDLGSLFDESIEYPMQFNAGFEYRGRQELQARLNVDFTYEWWSNTEYQIDGDVVDNAIEDVAIVKVGVEHIFYNQVPLQFGLQYRTAFQDRSSSRTLISAGTGYLGRGWEVQFAGGFSKLQYTFPDLFDDTLFGGDRSLSPTDDVEELYFFGLATLKLSLSR